MFGRCELCGKRMWWVTVSYRPYGVSQNLRCHANCALNEVILVTIWRNMSKH